MKAKSEMGKKIILVLILIVCICGGELMAAPPSVGLHEAAY